MIITKKVFDYITFEDISGRLTYQVIRNYKNGNSREIGKVYMTQRGVFRQVMHRNSCHMDRYGTTTITRRIK